MSNHTDRQDGPERDDSVGYKKPPKHGQFQKGTSGNPNGRPKRPAFDINSVFDGDLVANNGAAASKRELLVMRTLNDASRGNQRAFARLLQWIKKSDLMKDLTKSHHYNIIRIPRRWPQIREKALAYDAKVRGLDKKHVGG